MTPASDIAREDSPVIALLRRARKRVENPEHWTKGWYGRDDLGNDLTPTQLADFAVCFCIEGALRAENGGSLPQSAYAALCRVCERPHEFNDAPKTTHAAILKLFDHAIEREAISS